MVRIAEYFRHPDPPPVQGLVVVVYAVVRDEDGRVLLVRRIDDGNWELPGGRVEIGETTSQTVLREVAEESGITIVITGVSGVYSDPDHIVVYREEGALQQHAICLHAHPDPPRQRPRPDHEETTDAAWFSPATTRALTMQPDVRRRLDDAIGHPDHAHID
jgi:8-oxo-dGTP pyrophosphatase MutT (NUDIX family)